MADKSVEYYQQKLRQAEANAKFAENNGDTNQKNIFGAKLEAAKMDLRDAEAASGGTPPANSVDTSTSPAARAAQEPANTASTQTVKQSTPPSTENTYIRPPPLVEGTVRSQRPEDIAAERRINERLERSAWLDSLESGREYVPGEATGDPSAGFIPPPLPPSAVEPDPPLPTGYSEGRGGVVEPRTYDPPQTEGLNSTFYHNQKVRVAQSELDAARASGDFAQINEATAKYSAAYRDQQTALTARDGVPPNNSVTQADPTAYQAQQYSQNPLFPPPLQAGQAQENPYGTDEVTEGVEAGTAVSVPASQQQTSATPVGENRETVLGGYESEARAEATATRLIAREQSEARAQGREPAQYEVVETADDGYTIQKVTPGAATPADTGYVGDRGSVVEAPGERTAAAVSDDTGYSDPFAEGGDVQDIGEGAIVRSAEPVGPQFAENETAFGLGGERGTALRVQEGKQLSELEAAEQALADRELQQPPLTAKQREFRERNIAALRGDLEDTQEELEKLEVPTKEVPITAAERLENEVENTEPEPVDFDDEQEEDFPENLAPEPVDFDDEEEEDFPVTPTPPEEPAQVNNAALQRLREQSIVRQSRTDSPGDWRVKVRLGSGSQYFYKAPNPGILAPLRSTDGVVFPYTPNVVIMHSAEYNPYHPTHSNYQHYFYKGSRVQEVLVTGTFTAQDTEEANYLLAVMHFFKSASKMFYGQDAERGSPPPLLFLSGFGESFLNEAPCVISQFQLNMPNDVDYIRAQPNGKLEPGSLQSDLRNKGTGGASWSSSVNRLLNSDLSGAVDSVPFKQTASVSLSSDDATYVPTKIEMTITFLPVQNRLQVSEGFSLRDYANGSLIKGGYW